MCVNTSYIIILFAGKSVVHLTHRVVEHDLLIPKTNTDFHFLVSSIVLDVIFTIIPWIVVWNLSNSRREKIFIASSLSLSIV